MLFRLCNVSREIFCFIFGQLNTVKYQQNSHKNYCILFVRLHSHWQPRSCKLSLLASVNDKALIKTTKMTAMSDKSWTRSTFLHFLAALKSPRLSHYCEWGLTVQTTHCWPTKPDSNQCFSRHAHWAQYITFGTTLVNIFLNFSHLFYKIVFNSFLISSKFYYFFKFHFFCYFLFTLTNSLRAPCNFFKSFLYRILFNFRLTMTFLAIFRNEITTIMTPSTSEESEWGR